MGKIHNVFIKQHQRGRWRYHWGRALSRGTIFRITIINNYFLTLFEIIIDNKSKGVPKKKPLKQKIIISLTSPQEIYPPLIIKDIIIKNIETPTDKITDRKTE